MSVDKHALGHLREVRISPPEIQTLALIAKFGGEISWYPERVKPGANQMIDTLRKKHLVDLITSGGQALDGDVAGNIPSLVAQYGSRFRLRFTDQGRSIHSQLDAMTVRPKVEVTMPG